MKNKILIWALLILCFTGFSQNNNQVSKTWLEKSKNIASKRINDLLILDNDYNKSEINTVVSNSSIYEINKESVNNIFQETPDLLTLEIEQPNNETLTLELYREINAFSDLIITTSTREEIDFSSFKGLFYRGIIKNNTNSLVSISIYENEISGYISSQEGNRVIGKLKNEDKIIIYNDHDLESKPTFNCETEAKDLDESEIDNYNSVFKKSLTTNCVRLYFETEFDIYQNLGSNTSNVITYVTSLYNQVGTLYANDGISTILSHINIWVGTDPYTATSSSGLLSQFQSQTSSINGNLGQLLTFRSIGGGIAAGFNGICNSNVDLSLSVSGNLNSTITNVPLYSWNVMVVTHEFGHLFGSRHTHACVWNGNSTAIDGCSGYTEGGCPLPGIPSGGGTIMSYCHTNPVGINFSNGFGPQPTNVITNNVNSASCLTSCIPCPTSLNITANVNSPTVDIHQASSTINATNTINSGATGIYHAGDEVLLSNGFTSINGSIFRAYIEGCTNNFVAKNTQTIVEENSEIQTIEDSTIKIAPNPSNGTFSISLKEIKEGKIEILDLYGITIYKSEFKNQDSVDINIQDKPRGIYILKIYSDNKTYTSKVIKE